MGEIQAFRIQKKGLQSLDGSANGTLDISWCGWEIGNGGDATVSLSGITSWSRRDYAPDPSGGR